MSHPSRAAVLLSCAIASAAVGQAPSIGDGCANPHLRVGPGTVVLGSSTAFVGHAASCGGGVDPQDQWIAYTAASNAVCRVSTCPASPGAPGGANAGLSTYVAAYAACPGPSGAPFVCDDGTGSACGFGGGGEIAFACTAGAVYFVQIGEWNAHGSVAGVAVAISETALPAGVAADTCAAAPTVGAGLFPFSSAGFVAAGPAASCGPALGDPFDAWVRYVPPAAGTATFSLCPSSVAAPGGGVIGSALPYLAVWEGASCASMTQVACATSSPACGGGSAEASFPVCPGAAYFVQVGRRGTSAALSGTLAIAFSPAVPTALTGDAPDNPLPLVPGVNAFNGAGFSVPGPAGSLSASPDPADVWFALTAPANGFAFLSTCPSSPSAPPGSLPPVSFGYWLRAWSTTLCGAAGVELASSQFGSCGNAAPDLQFAVVAGTTYLVQLRTLLGGTTFAGVLGVAVVPHPVNDACAGASPIGVGATIVSTVAATTSPGAATCGGSTATNDVWYSFTPPCSAGVVIDVCTNGAAVSPMIAVYAGCGGPLLACSANPGWNLPCGSLPRLTVPAPPAGVPLLIAAGDAAGSFGTYTIDVRCDYSLRWSQPAGPGTLRLETLDGPSGGFVYAAVTLDVLHPGMPAGTSFPNGWWYGVPMGGPELIAQLTWPGGLPFVGILNPAGYLQHFSGPLGGLSALAGLATIWSVGIALDPLTGFANVADVTPPTAYPL